MGSAGPVTMNRRRDPRQMPLACARHTIPTRKLLLENDRSILRSGRFGDADRITPAHVRPDLGWIFAGTKNDGPQRQGTASTGAQNRVSRHQDESCAAAYSGILRSPARASPFEERFPIQETDRVITEPAAATGFRRSRASPLWRPSSRPPIRRHTVHGKEIIRLELRVVGQDLFPRRPAGKRFQNLLNGDPVAANARLLNRTSGSIVIRSGTELWSAGILVPRSHRSRRCPNQNLQKNRRWAGSNLFTPASHFEMHTFARPVRRLSVETREGR